MACPKSEACQIASRMTGFTRDSGHLKRALSSPAAIAVNEQLELKAHAEDVGIVHFLTTRGGLRI
jgi:hypothetical protein